MKAPRRKSSVSMFTPTVCLFMLGSVVVLPECDPPAQDAATRQAEDQNKDVLACTGDSEDDPHEAGQACARAGSRAHGTDAALGRSYLMHGCDVLAYEEACKTLLDFVVPQVSTGQSFDGNNNLASEDRTVSSSQVDPNVPQIEVDKLRLTIRRLCSGSQLSGETCVRLADSFAENQPQNLDAAKSLYASQCARGQGDACVSARKMGVQTTAFTTFAEANAAFQATGESNVVSSEPSSNDDSSGQDQGEDNSAASPNYNVAPDAINQEMQRQVHSILQTNRPRPAPSGGGGSGGVTNGGCKAGTHPCAPGVAWDCCNDSNNQPD